MDENENWMAAKWKDAEEYYAATGFSIKLEEFIALIAFLSIIAIIVAYALTLFIKVESATRTILPIFAFLSMISLIYGVPYYIRTTRVEKIETALPDVLKHISAVLKAGGTLENALEEIAASDYGPMSALVEKGLKQLKEGQTIDEVLETMAANSGSPLFKRVAHVTVDSKRAGAGLADVLEAIASDTRELVHIKRERVSRSTMHTSFLYITSLFLVPFIFGFTLAIVKFIGAGMAQAGANAAVDFGQFDILLIVFLMILVLIANFAIGIISEGKVTKKLVYIPFMVLLALTIYQIGGFLGQTIIQGGS